MPRFAKILKIRKTQLALALVLVLGLSLIPVYGAHAMGIFDMVTGAASTVSEVIVGILNAFLYVIGHALGVALAGIATMADAVMQPKPITTDPTLQMAWGITRDFANMFFILILLGIALDFILFNSFKVKQMIPQLILVALLINFSLPIAGVLIDFANVFSQYFLSQITDNTNAFTGVIAQKLSLVSLLTNDTKGIIDNLKVQNMVFLNMVFIILFMAGTAFVFLVLALMFLVRTGYLYVLLAILPLVLVLSAFPPTAGRFGQWTGKFIQWTMFAPIAMFFLWFATIMADTLIKDSTAIGIQDLNIAGSFYKYIIVWIFLLGALTAAQGMGGTAAGMAMKTAGWVKGKTIKGLKSGGRRTGEVLGVAKVLEKGAEWAGKAPLVGGFGARVMGGAAANLRQAKLEAAELSKGEREMVEKASPEQVMSLIEGYSKGTPDQRAKAAKLASLAEKEGKFGVRHTSGQFKGEINDAETLELKQSLHNTAYGRGDYATAKAIAGTDYRIRKQNVTDKYAKLDASTIRVNPRTGNPEKFDAKSGLYQSEASAQVYKDIKPAEIGEMKGAQMDQVALKNLAENMINEKALTMRHLQEAIDNNQWEFLAEVKKYIHNAPPDGLGAPAGGIGSPAGRLPSGIGVVASGLYEKHAVLASQIDNSPSGKTILAAIV